MWNQPFCCTKFGNLGISYHDYGIAYCFTVTIVDTGLNTMTGGRVKRIQKYVGKETFMLTYGDGVCNINFDALVKYHKEHGKIATISAVNVGQRFGCLDFGPDDKSITAFREKNNMDGSFINAGFMVLNSKIFDYLKNDKTVFEKEPLETLAKEGQLMAYKHDGFWQCMDTLRDKQLLEYLWENNKAPWKVW